MNEQIFKKQIEGGERAMYGIKTIQDCGYAVEIHFHQGPLDTFPTNLEFVEMMGKSTILSPTVTLSPIFSIPLFKRK